MGTLAAAALCGILIGILSGLLGIGGGAVMIPLFRLGFGLPAIYATATSLFSIIPTSVSGCITHLRNHTCVPALGVAAGIGGALMSPLGVQLAQHSPSWVIMLAAALVIGYSAYKMLKKGLALPKGVQGARSTKDTPARHLNAQKRPMLNRKQLAVGFAIGLVTGLVSGYVGVGGGFIMIPLFIAFAKISMKQASGTSLIAVAILATPGVAAQLALGNVQICIGLAIAIGSIPGATVGANLVKYTNERALRLMFGTMLLVAAVLMAANELLLS